MDTTRSDLTKALVRAGLRKATAPTVMKRGIKEPGAAKNGAHRQLPTKGQEGEALLHGGGIRLVWSNPAAMRKTAGRKTSAAFPMIAGGRK